MSRKRKSQADDERSRIWTNAFAKAGVVFMFCGGFVGLPIYVIVTILWRLDVMSKPSLWWTTPMVGSMLAGGLLIFVSSILDREG